MAYSKKPVYQFENETSTGINKIPQGRVITIDSYEGEAKMYIVTGSTKDLTDTTTIKEAVDKSILDEFGGGSGGGGGSSDTTNNSWTPGAKGFGVGIAPESITTALKLTGQGGYNNVESVNYGNYVDGSGNVFVFIPKFYFKWEKNTIHISKTLKSGYVIHRAFINAGKEIDGFFIGKYQMSSGATSKRNGSTWHSQQGQAYVAAANKLGDRYTTINVFMFNALALLSKAQRQSGVNCAWVDVSPYYPKGNNNSGKDVNDPSISFVGTQPANTGSGNPFTKTTHNGQDSGVADINGNVWDFALGITCDGAKFYVAKQTTDMAKFAEGVSSGANLVPQNHWGDSSYLNASSGFFDELSTTKIPLGGSTQHVYFGNGNEQVFPFSTDKNSDDYIKCCLGIPLSSGVSTTGTEEFGNDCFYHVSSKTNHLHMLVGGSYADSGAGVWTQHAYDSRTHSAQGCSSRLAILPA